MSTCNHCGQEANAAYHAECWREYQRQRARAEERRMLEAREIIAAIREGRPIDPPSADVEMEYGDYFRAQRDIRAGRRE